MLCKKYKILEEVTFKRFIKQRPILRCDECYIFKKYNQCLSINLGIICDIANNTEVRVYYYVN